MLNRRAAILTPLALPALAQPAAQGWPGAAPVALVIPYSPGGASDVVGRIAQSAIQRLGATVVLDHKPGATTTLAARHVKAARPDGNTLLLGTIATFSLAPNSFRNTGYDSLEDFSHITQLVDTLSVLVANPRWPSLGALLAAARQRPGELSYASWGVGSTAHLPMLDLLQRAGAEMLHVPYNGAPPALTDVIAGRVDCMVVLLAAARGHIDGGRVRPLGVVNPVRTDALPGIATIAEQGFAGFGYAGWFSLQGPLGMPAGVAQRIRQAVREHLPDAEVQRVAFQNGLATTPPDEQGEAPLRARIGRELPLFQRLMAQAGVQPE